MIIINKGLYAILAILLFILILLNLEKLSFFNRKPQIFFKNQDNNTINLEIDNCFVKIEERIVKGNSLSPLVKSGQIIKVLFNYYNCYPIDRKDVVLFDYAGNKNSVIKIVKGISGDRFELKELDSGWNIIINNQIVKNSEDKPYLISGNAYKMLSLYERDYNGVIPKDAYLLLGNRISGSVDSTTFGLVDKSGIIAKVEI